MLEGLKPINATQRCRIANVSESLKGKDRELFDGYIADRGFPAEQLSDQLKVAAGIVIGPSTIRKHRNGACWCAKLA